MVSLFPPPRDVETRVSARIPDRYRVSGRRSDWVDIQRGGADTGCFLEGPSFDRDGNLYVVDVPWGRIFRISPDGRDTDLIAEYDGEPNGLNIHRNGRIFVADFKHGIMELDTNRKVYPPLAARHRTTCPFSGSPGLGVTAHNGAYVVSRAAIGKNLHGNLSARRG